MLTIINTVGLFLSPVIAVVVTLAWQARKEHRDRQQQLFFVLMAHRRRWPPTQDWVDALNLIDVVFAKHEKLLSLWHQYYDLLASVEFAKESQKREHKYLEMLSEMARVLGFRHLQQTDIDKYYSPKYHGNEADLEWSIRQELLRVLKNSQHILIPQHGSETSTPGELPRTADQTGTPSEPANEIKRVDNG